MKGLIFSFSLILLNSCANLDEYIIPENWQSIKISATASDFSKEQAMAEAHRKALIKIDELGCDQDKGRGDVSYKRMGSGYIAEAIYKIAKKYCEKRISCKDEEWTRESVRTQGGEWIWFMGKGTSISRAEADDMSKSEALKRLVSECKIAHKGLRFIERCEDFTVNSFVVMTRASIKHVECSEGRNATVFDVDKLTSPELNRLLYK